MLKSIIILTCLIGYSSAGLLGSKHHVRFKSRQDRNVPLADADDTQKEDKPILHTPKLNLPSNSTSIRADIKEGFSCENRVYGYYADMENDCQIFHVCMPVTYGDGKERFFRWSFICPEETVFSQDSFTCMHRQDMLIDCRESMHYYELNRNFGALNEDTIRHTAVKYHHDEKSEAESSEVKLEVEKNSEPAEVTETIIDIVTSSPIKPIKIYKLNRRKPTNSPALQKVTESTPTKIIVKNTSQNIQKPSTSMSPLKKNKPQLNVVKKPFIATIKSNSKPKITKTKPKIEVPLLNLLSEQNNKNEEIQKPDISIETKATEIKNVKDSVPITQANILLEDNKSEASEPSDIQVTTVEKTKEPTEIVDSVPEKTAVKDESAIDSQGSVLPADMTTDEQSFLKQSMGGFESVDPTMAAEAEALINDFLQTMLKTENPIVDVPAPTQLTDLEATEISKDEEKAKDTKVTELDSQINTQNNGDTEAPLATLVEEDKKDIAEEKPQSVQLNQLADQTYQIPVAIVQDPVEHAQSVIHEVKTDTDLEAYQPISIDHVVASVKEQINQASATPSPVDVQEPIAEESAEPIIVPIYHREPSIQPQIADSNDAAPAEAQKKEHLHIADNPETE